MIKCEHISMTRSDGDLYLRFYSDNAGCVIEELVILDEGMEKILRDSLNAHKEIPLSGLVDGDPKFFVAPDDYERK